MTRVGFIGLGVMGRPMASNLLAAGFDVTVHNRSRDAADDLVGKGADWGADPAEVASSCEAVITMLPDSPDVEQVVLGERGVLEGAEPGLLLIDMSTIRPDTARLVAQQAAQRGVRALDAPVSGGEQGAIDGALSIMVGGSEEDFSAAQPILGALGKTVALVGPAGAGQTVKAANQILVAGILELVSEVVVLLQAHDLDPEPALRVLAGGLAGNRILETKTRGMLAREFKPGFRVDLHHKDLGIALAAARETGVAVPVTAVVAQLLVALRSAGRGGLDHSAVLTVIEDLSGRSRPVDQPEA